MPKSGVRKPESLERRAAARVAPAPTNSKRSGVRRAASRTEAKPDPQRLSLTISAFTSSWEYLNLFYADLSFPSTVGLQTEVNLGSPRDPKSTLVTFALQRFQLIFVYLV